MWIKEYDLGYTCYAKVCVMRAISHFSLYFVSFFREIAVKNEEKKTSMAHEPQPGLKECHLPGFRAL